MLHLTNVARQLTGLAVSVMGNTRTACCGMAKSAEILVACRLRDGWDRVNDRFAEKYEPVSGGSSQRYLVSDRFSISARSL